MEGRAGTAFSWCQCGVHSGWRKRVTGGGDKEVAGGQIGPGLVASWGQGEQREGKRERKEERGGGKKRQKEIAMGMNSLPFSVLLVQSYK